MRTAIQLDIQEIDVSTREVYAPLWYATMEVSVGVVGARAASDRTCQTKSVSPTETALVPLATLGTAASALHRTGVKYQALS